MMRPASRCILLCLIAGLFSCQQDNDLPQGIIPPDTMVQVLADIYLHEAILSNVPARFDSLDHYRREQLDDVFALHRISRARFDSSYHFYEKDIDRLLELQDAMLIELTKRKDRMMKERGKDSLPE
jgi:hypothetical protein